MKRREQSEIGYNISTQQIQVTSTYFLQPAIVSLSFFYTENSFKNFKLTFHVMHPNVYYFIKI